MIERENNLATPPGFEKCPECGEYRGITRAKHLNWSPGPMEPDPEQEISVTCSLRGYLVQAVQAD